jgi:FkbM family methyltransferase
MAADYDSIIDRYVTTPPAIHKQLRAAFGQAQDIVVFDVGACEAEDAIRYALFFPHPRVYAFEPLPANVAKAVANVNRLDVQDRVEVVAIALSDQNGTAELHVSSGHPDNIERDGSWDYGNKSSSLLSPAGVKATTKWLEWNEVISVETATLDDFCRSRDIHRVDFLHVDVQGAELMVLEGAKSILPTVQMIWIEVEQKQLYTGQPLLDDVERFMRAQGFAKVLDAVGEVDGDQLYCRPPRRFRMRLIDVPRRARVRARRAKNAVLSRARATG